MESRRKIVIYGHSLFLAGIEVSLRKKAHLRVMRVDNNLPHAMHQLATICPDAVIAEMNAYDAERTLTLLRSQPNLPVIGVNLDSDMLTVLCSRQYAVQMMTDLVHVINQVTADAERCLSTGNQI